MKKLIKQHNPKMHARSFKYAFQGIFHALLNEPNFRIHLFATVVVTVLGIYLKISNMEWVAIVLISAMVLTAEMMNTVVENVLDYMFTEYHEVAKVVKDLTAGYVLVTAIAALLIFVLIFGHKLRNLYYNYINYQTIDYHIGIEEYREQNPDSKVEMGKAGTDEVEQSFYGQSLRDSCSTDSNCKVSGCNQEICGTEELASICVLPNIPLPIELGLGCACVNNVCQWN